MGQTDLVLAVKDPPPSALSGGSKASPLPPDTRPQEQSSHLRQPEAFSSLALRDEQSPLAALVLQGGQGFLAGEAGV